MASAARAEQVDLAAAVEVHRVFHQAAGHELRHADGAGKRALQRQRIDAVLAREQQRRFQLAAEEGHALAPLRRFRIGEGQRGQRVEHAEAAGVAAVHGFDADDADQDFGRDAVQRFGAASVSAFSFQNLTPASMRTGSTVRRL
jgi:hypothetical protein